MVTSSQVVTATTQITTAPAVVRSLSIAAGADTAEAEIVDGNADGAPKRGAVRAVANTTAQIRFAGVGVNQLRVVLIAGTTPKITVEYA